MKILPIFMNVGEISITYWAKWMAHLLKICNLFLKSVLLMQNYPFCALFMSQKFYQNYRSILFKIHIFWVIDSNKRITKQFLYKKLKILPSFSWRKISEGKTYREKCKKWVWFCPENNHAISSFHFFEKRNHDDFLKKAYL